MPLSVLAILLVISGCRTSRPEATHLEAVGALGPYAGSVTYGDLIFASGKIGERGGSFEREVQTTIDAVETELARSGATLDDILQATVFLTDLNNYGEFNDIYGRRLGKPFPARACVEVSRLPGGARVEIQAIARRP